MIEYSGQSRDIVSSFLDWEPETLQKPDHIEIHTSDRNLFRRCRRKWNWQSGLRENLVPLGQTAAPLWFGSGFHFVMEDFFGRRVFPTVDHAIVGYKDAFKRQELPDDINKWMDLLAGMVHYYVDDWLVYHPEPWETLVVDGVPQVEVDADIDITERLIRRAADRFGPEWVVWFTEVVLKDRPVVYRMTFDRVVVDSFGLVYILDYKTARQIDNNKLANDPQVTAYYWGGSEFYGDQLNGIIWQQHLKALPDMPEWLSSSQRFSFNKNQKTTWPLYRRALKEKYGRIPTEYREILNYFATEHSGDWGDRFIRRDILRRNPHTRRSEEAKILDEVLDMLDPNLPLYPNPTRDCNWDCPYRDACIGMDDGSDVEYLLESAFEKWRGYKQDWKKRVIMPDGSEYA